MNIEEINDKISLLSCKDVCVLTDAYKDYLTGGNKKFFIIICEFYGITPQEFIFWYNF